MVERKSAEVFRLLGCRANLHYSWGSFRESDAYDVVEKLRRVEIFGHSEVLAHQPHLFHAVEGVCAYVGGFLAQSHHIPPLLVAFHEIWVEQDVALRP